jgi:F0F1-type ATP synthase membrane subunit b/b'
VAKTPISAQRIRAELRRARARVQRAEEYLDGAQRGLDEAREQADGAARRLLALDAVLARRKAEPETNEPDAEP